MNAIKFNYLYRDNSNYKQFGSCLFSNRNNLPMEVVKSKIESKLIDGEYFVAENWKVTNLFFESRTEDDHDWHEFESVEIITTAEISTERNIEDFLGQILK